MSTPPCLRHIRDGVQHTNRGDPQPTGSPLHEDGVWSIDMLPLQVVHCTHVVNTVFRTLVRWVHRTLGFGGSEDAQVTVVVRTVIEQAIRCPQLT